MSSKSKQTTILVAASALAACVPAGDGQFSGTLGTASAEVEESSPMALVFDEAAEVWGVPADVLEAVAYHETRFVPATGEIEFDGQPEPWGVFALRGEELELASQLSGYTPEQIKTELEAQVHSAAALLSHYADVAGIDEALRVEPMVWGPAIGKYGQLDHEFQEVYAQDVLRHLRTGLAVPTPDGHTLIIGRHGDMDGEIGTEGRAIRAAGTVWKPSPNYNSRGGRGPRFVVIHTCEGSYAGCVSWLRNRRSGVSAHYVVNDDGSEISQLVEEENRAWHIGARYRSRLNSGRMTELEGQSSNTYSVGIEHAGRAAQPRWNDGLIQASARLVRGITDRHSIPKDRYHIVAHGQLQPESRVDPGPNWPWTEYLALISGGATTPPPPPPEPEPQPEPQPQPPPTNPARIVTVDNDTQGRFRASSNWDLSSWSSGKVGRDYRFRRPAFTSDLAEWRVPVPETGRYEVFARVPGNGYNTKAPFLVRHRGGTAVVQRNLRLHGGEWMSLGTFDLSRGDDWIVALSCWTNGDGYLIADAVRIERR